MGFAMAIVAPKGRKHLSAGALFRLVRSGFVNIADDGPDDVDISLTETDVLMSALAMFSLQSPSLLAFEQQRAEGNVHMIYGIERVPCDTYRRERLDMVSPKSLRSVCTHLFRQLQCGQALEERMFRDGYYLLARAGTGYFSSTTMHCASCWQRVHRNGAITSYHQMLGAALIHPDVRTVISWMPEPIGKQDGTDKNDGERNAAKRFIVKLPPGPPLPPVHQHRRQPEYQCSAHRDPAQPRSALYPWSQRRRSCLFVPAGAGGGGRRTRDLV